MVMHQLLISCVYPIFRCAQYIHALHPRGGIKYWDRCIDPNEINIAEYFDRQVNAALYTNAESRIFFKSKSNNIFDEVSGLKKVKTRPEPSSVQHLRFLSAPQCELFIRNSYDSF